MPAGGVINAPIAPMPPAFATAIDKLAGDAPAIGASMIGSAKPYRAQNAAARSSARGLAFAAPCVRSTPSPLVILPI